MTRHHEILRQGRDRVHSRKSRILWLEPLEVRALLTEVFPTGPGGGSITSRAGVGFTLNPVAYIIGSSDKASDYHVRIDWGDGGPLDSGLVLTKDTLVSFPHFLVSGSHVYQEPGTYNTTVYVQETRFQAVSATNVTLVSLLPNAASRPPDLPQIYPGVIPPTGFVDLVPEYIPLQAVAGVAIVPTDSEDSDLTVLEGRYNGEKDFTPSDYHVQLNWGDSPHWDSSVTLTPPTTPGTQGVHVKGSHAYQTAGIYYVTVYVTGPDGQSRTGVEREVDVNPAPPLPDIHMVNASLDASMTTVTFSYEVSGNTGPFQVALYRSEGTTFDPATAKLAGPPVTVNPAANSSAQGPLTLTNPMIDASKPNLLVVADPPSSLKPHGSILESNESNNVKIVPPVVQPVIAMVSASLTSDNQGVNASYKISGSNFAKAGTIDFYWATGQNLSDAIESTPVAAVPTATAASANPYTASTTIASLGTQPPNATYILAVANSPHANPDHKVVIRPCTRVTSSQLDSQVLRGEPRWGTAFEWKL